MKTTIDEERAKQIGEAMRLLSEVIAREEHAFERVWMDEFAQWEYKGIPIMEHDEDDAFLGALEDLLYCPKVV